LAESRHTTFLDRWPILVRNGRLLFRRNPSGVMRTKSRAKGRRKQVLVVFKSRTHYSLTYTVHEAPAAAFAELANGTIVDGELPALG
jgi:hypothetical protein